MQRLGRKKKERDRAKAYRTIEKLLKTIEKKFLFLINENWLTNIRKNVNG